MATDTVSVLVSDLEDIRSLLLTSEARGEAWDLFISYARLGNRLQYSPLTKALGEKAQTVEAYIQAAQEEEEDDAPEG